jgi:NAD+ diphosphatase
MPASDPIAAARPFTGMALDRASTERKDPAWIDRLRDDPATRAVAAGHDGVLMSEGAPSLLRLQLDRDRAPEPILLGLEPDGSALFGVDLDELSPSARAESVDGAGVVSLRDAGSVLSYPEAGLAAYLVALLNWHRRHRFCANCGAGTTIAEGGYSRHCPRCGATHFPRTDPVVIMTVEHQGRLLLGRRTGWPPGRLSVLAGFVSPGESAEEAVVREVQEESGIVAHDPSFVTSQPWPFPASLMLGFHAQCNGGEPRPRDGELEEVRWLTLDAVRAAMRGENPDFKLPPSVSIARFLIERWVAGHAAAGGAR